MEEKRRAGSSEKKDEITPVEKEIKKDEETRIEINENKLQNLKEEKNKTKKKKKRKIKLSKRMVVCIVLIAICIVVTVLLITLKLKQLDEAYTYVEEETVFETENKAEDDDLKYVVTDGDTLDYNNLEYETVYVANGEETTEYPTGSTVDYQYVVISGLKDKTIENKINSEIKNRVIELENSGQDVTYVYPQGNFNGIFSVYIYVYEGQKYYSLNYDLSTGETFELEDVFVKSAPIVNILYNALIEEMALTIPITYDSSMSDEEYFSLRNQLLDMNNRDTSDYEEMLFKISSWYKENKGSISFCVSSTKVYVYNVSIDGTEYTLEIPLYNYKDYVAIYKRYLNNDIFELNNYSGGYIPFTYPIIYWKNGLSSLQYAYGKLTDNLYVDIAREYENSDSVPTAVYSYAENLANNLVADAKSRSSSNTQRGYIVQDIIQVIDNTDRANYYNSYVGGYPIPYYSVQITRYEIDIPISDYANLDEYLAKAALVRTASVGIVPLSQYFIINNLFNIENTFESENYFFDQNGNFLGTEWSVLLDTSRNSTNPS